MDDVLFRLAQRVANKLGFCFDVSIDAIHSETDLNFDKLEIRIRTAEITMILQKHWGVYKINADCRFIVNLFLLKMSYIY